MSLEMLKPESETTSWVTATQRLWLTVDRSRLVPDGHRDAAVLFCVPGTHLAVEDARRLGILDDGRPEKLEAGPPAKLEAELPAKLEAEPRPLADRSVRELRDVAAEMGVDLGDVTRKADIVAAIEAASRPDEGEGPV